MGWKVPPLIASDGGGGPIFTSHDDGATGKPHLSLSPAASVNLYVVLGSSFISLVKTLVPNAISCPLYPSGWGLTVRNCSTGWLGARGLLKVKPKLVEGCARPLLLSLKGVRSTTCVPSVVKKSHVL